MGVEDGLAVGVAVRLIVGVKSSVGVAETVEVGVTVAEGEALGVAEPVEGKGYFLNIPLALPGITWILWATNTPSSLRLPTATILCPTTRALTVESSMPLILTAVWAVVIIL